MARRPTCEGTPAIDIRDWAAEELLAPGARWVINCYRCDEQAGTIRAAIGDDRVTLNFETRIREGKWRPRRQDIGLGYTTLRFGGRCTWFVCPACGRRRAALYFLHGEFGCRRCQGLAYRSQRESRRNHKRHRTEAPTDAPAETSAQ